MINKLLSNLLILGLVSLNTFSGKTENESLPESSEQASVDDSSTSTQPLLEDLILEEICVLCEREGFNERDPFCLTYNLRNIRYILPRIKLYLQVKKNFIFIKEDKLSEVEKCRFICNHINSYLKDILKTSHFCLDLKSDELKTTKIFEIFKEQEEKPCEFIIEDHYVKIKIPDFRDNSKIEQFKFGFHEVVGKQKGIIVDLRDNLGGNMYHLQCFLSYFFNNKIILTYTINRKHEQFFGEMAPWKEQHSKQELKELIATIESNWKLGKKSEESWQMNPESNGHPIIQKNIAILINERSASCSEIFTLTLKGHYPDRVKVIGQKSAGELLSALPSQSLTSFPGLSLTYPISEIIGIDGTRVEGVGIEPDIVSNDEEEIMKAAIEWVTQDSI